MSAALDEAVADPEVRAIIITGAGRAFSAGMDRGQAGPAARPRMALRRSVGQSASDWIDSWRGREGNEFLRLWELDSRSSAPSTAGPWAPARGWRCAPTSPSPRRTRSSPSRGAPRLQHELPLDHAGGGQELAPLRPWWGTTSTPRKRCASAWSSRSCPTDRLLDECFELAERIALVPPETVKINLSIATLGMEMMGLRDALMLDSQLSAPAHVMLREEAPPAPERGPREEHPRVPATARRPVPARTVRPAIEAQGVGPPARDCPQKEATVSQGDPHVHLSESSLQETA